MVPLAVAQSAVVPLQLSGTQSGLVELLIKTEVEKQTKSLRLKIIELENKVKQLETKIENGQKQIPPPQISPPPNLPTPNLPTPKDNYTKWRKIACQKLTLLRHNETVLATYVKRNH